MSEIFLYSICIISMALSIASLYLSLSLAKSIKVAHQNLQVLFQVLSQPHDIIYSYDEYDDYGEELQDHKLSKDDKVVDLFSREPLEWNSDLNEWVPKTRD